MPLKDKEEKIVKCQKNGESGFKANTGTATCYLPSEEGDKEQARRKAMMQMKAILANEDEE